MLAYVLALLYDTSMLIRRTYSISEKELEDAIKKAKQRDKSLSQLIRDYLVKLPFLK